MSLQSFTHYGLHYLFPAILAFVFFRAEWKKVWGIFVLTMLVDLDHLLANPIFQPDRCSIGFHPLHCSPAIMAYVVLLFLPKYFRIVGIALLLHMLTDFIDCLFMYSRCAACYEKTAVWPVLSWVGNLLGL